MALPERDDWDRHWEDYAEVATLNPAQRYRTRLMLRYLRPASGDGKVLDIGSGQGDFAVALRKQHPQAQILGLELSRAGCEIAASNVPDARFLVRNLLEDVDPPDEHRAWATHAVCSEVLEHLDDPGLLLRNSTAYMQPKCLLVVTVPGGPMSAFDKHIGHRRHFTPRSLSAVLEESGFVVESTARTGFPFHNLYRLLVILRGKKLIEDAKATQAISSNWLSRLMMIAFDSLFRLNLSRSPLGWQIVAVARYQGNSTG